MPIYEYTCASCGKTIDVLQKMSDPAPAVCSACGAQNSLSRQVSLTSFQLKGGGWYKDLYGSSKKDSGTSNSSGAPSSGGSSSDSSSSSGGTSSSGTSSSTPSSGSSSASPSTSSSSGGTSTPSSGSKG